MWVEGGKYGSIDPCYPSKVGAGAHPQPALPPPHRRRSRSTTSSSRSSRTCRSFVDERDGQRVAARSSRARPKVMKAAFTKEIDFFAERGIEYLDPALTFDRADAAASSSMFETFGPAPRHHRGRERLRVSTRRGRRSTRSTTTCRTRAARSSRRSRRENRVAILMLGRPYHSDPGLNHGILEEFQVLGYPILSIRSIPKDPRVRSTRYFEEDLDEGRHRDAARASTDVWPENYSANSVQKVWAAKFAARHPNVVVLDLSSFKCGHDAPTYGLIDSIIASAARRRTRRSTTSTPTSRAARSRSASRPTRTR